ncbi:MAG: glutamate--tRNA ligase family protein [Parcubacteria group bacterium]
MFGFFNKNKKIVTRFAPSPTGLLHMGNYRTAVFAFLYARKNDGKFILRIEDTDRQRSKKEYEDNIVESLEWLGLKYDAFYRQSENIKDHTEVLEKLIKENKAYISKEEAKDGSGIIKEIVRFRNPKKVVAFDDLVRGRIETDTTDLGDFVIAKSLTEPLFHLAVIVDDHNEGVTHVIRGEDHIPNTPRQILIHEALGMDVPKYAHLPLVLAEDRTKLSKRKGALPVTDYKDKGYLPQTLLNFMALIGWNPGGVEEVFSLDQLIEKFDITKIQKGGGIFNPEKLDWLNKEHMKILPIDTINAEIKKRLNKNSIEVTDDLLVKISSTIFDRISKWGDVDTMVREGELSYFFDDPKYDSTLLCWKGKSLTEAKEHLSWIEKTLKPADDSMFESAEKVKSLIFDYATEKGRGDVLWPLRVALSGKEKSPDPFTLLYILGKEKSLSRINNAINL